MKKSFYPVLIEALIFAFVLGTDQALKAWAQNMIEPMNIGPLQLQLAYNYGVIGGSLAGLPALMKSVTLASIGSFIFCFYLFSRFIFPMKSNWLKAGLATFIAGILGNVCDRFLVESSAVIDFIKVGNAVANPADFYQVLGSFMIIFGLWKDSQTFWFKNDQRKLNMVMPQFQLKLTLSLTILGMMSGLVTSAMSYAFLKVVLLNQEHLYSYLIAIGVTQASLTLVLIICGSLISGKIAGPLYAIHRYLKGAEHGPQKDFKLRTHDEFKEFEEPLNAVNSRLKGEDKKDAA